MLNFPSSGSIFSKPLKKCFKAPEGFIVGAYDYDQLEDRVICNITNDDAKSAIFEYGYDSHMYNAIHYGYPELKEVKEAFYATENIDERIKILLDAKEKYDKTRSKSKAVTFKLAYLGMADYHKGGKVTEEIYNNYHELYSGLKAYRDEKIEPSVRNKGYLHLGLGCRLYSDNYDNDIRTLNNSYCQFWSILTLIAINEINLRIEENGYEDDVRVVSTIYDAIYFNIRKDVKIIKWLNDNIIDIMSKPFIENQRISLGCAGEYGDNWAELVELPNGATEEEIKELLDGR